jgi:biopolymer transport protein TolR
MKRIFDNEISLVAKINVTPIIDVALVLVIILLITAPMLSVADIEVDLPRAQTRGSEDEARVSITLSTNGELAVNEDIVRPEMLCSALHSILSSASDENMLVVLRADQDVPYEIIRAVLGEARAAGAKRLAIATHQSDKGKP